MENIIEGSLSETELKQFELGQKEGFIQGRQSMANEILRLLESTIGEKK